MFADVCQIAIETVPVDELGTLGCAMAGAVMTGRYKNLTEAAEYMIPPGIRVEPNPDKFDVYRRKFRQYQCLIKTLETFW